MCLCFCRSNLQQHSIDRIDSTKSSSASLTLTRTVMSTRSTRRTVAARHATGKAYVATASVSPSRKARQQSQQSDDEQQSTASPQKQNSRTPVKRSTSRRAKSRQQDTHDDSESTHAQESQSKSYSTSIKPQSSAFAFPSLDRSNSFLGRPVSQHAIAQQHARCTSPGHNLNYTQIAQSPQTRHHDDLLNLDSSRESSHQSSQRHSFGSSSGSTTNGNYKTVASGTHAIAGTGSMLLRSELQHSSRHHEPLSPLSISTHSQNYERVRRQGENLSSDTRCFGLWRRVQQCVFTWNVESALYMCEGWERALFNSLVVLLAWGCIQFAMSSHKEDR